MRLLNSKLFALTLMAASVFVTHCQKAPGRKVKATVNQAAKPADVKLADCSVKAIDALKERKKNRTEIETILKEPDKIDAAQKQALINGVDQLKKNSKAATDEMEKLKPQGSSVPSKGCKGLDVDSPAEAAKQKNYLIVEIKKADEKLVADAAKYTTGETNPVQPVAPTINDAEIIQGQKIEISKSLGEAFENTTSTEKTVLIQTGTIVSSLDRAEDVQKIEADKSKSYCKITGFGPKIAERSKLDVTGLTQESDNSIAVTMTIQDKIYGLKCTIAEGKTQSKSGEIRASLGALIKVVQNAP